MKTQIEIQNASTNQAAEVSKLVAGLLTEIASLTNSAPFSTSVLEIEKNIRAVIGKNRMWLLLAIHKEAIVGFVNLTVAYALYTGGKYGIITEFYVRPEFRSQGIGEILIDAGKAFAAKKQWRRLEVTTPPLPAFTRSLKFYERNGFQITGGRKLKFEVASEGMIRVLFAEPCQDRK